ncbi:MAG: N-6 DNA methylase [Arcobacter sp.]|uniref:type ISP restriction/modification enzyme n=1 Tax=Arcobacter sp. TaxID=1872629 RepID=UPI00258C98DB|nr:type ISP restriction/modification enzyme [Arcobacter sp.]MDD3007356.1 N-6 DNA methylase [Arcobacter sp.]
MQYIHTYINNCNRLFQTGNAREHSYRGDLQQLLNEIINDKDIVVTNEPARIVNVGAPDYSITKKDIPLGYIEAKDINKPLGSKDYQEQFDRYKNALDNLIITDYLDFWFYKNGELTIKIQIAKIENGVVIPVSENFSLFENNIKSFVTFVSQTITSPSKLAKMMAGKARLLEDVIEKAILSEDENEANNSLREQLEIFKASLIHDITPQSFADIYAQTIAYGMFAARLHDTTLQNFSRQEAVFLIPKSNPFLRGLFNYVSGAECDDRLIWIIDSLAEIFLATDVKKLLEGFSLKTGMNDPIIHFYETFLGEYNPALRKSRGVWYTPEAVVNFIVRACDEVLKDEFALSDGLSDETKIKIKVDDHDAGYTKTGQKRQKEIEVHKVQVLDPATGTGTFLAETIKFIKKDFWGGSWSSYVEEHLIPRLNGFELLMASYAMAHLKLDLLLLETGYKPTKEQKRFNVFLTNSLESHHEHTGSLFSSYLANESKAADRVKKEVPVMVVMGNPPYSGESSNKNDFIDKLLEDYKKESDGSKLKEKNSKWLNDDYVKFIRYSESYIEKNQEGILAFITNNSYINNPTFRGMRYHLLSTFDKIYIINLHGDSKKKEVCHDGSKDENVFDIMQGVAIIIGIKKKTKSKKLAELFMYDLYGKRDYKYEFLSENSLKSLDFKQIKFSEPNFYFERRNDKLENNYLDSIDLNLLFPINGVGITTAHDKFVIDDSKSVLIERYEQFKAFDPKSTNLYKKFGVKEKKGWNIIDGWNNLQKIENIESLIQPISYRLFDDKYIIYEDKLVWRTTRQIGKHFINDKDNIGLVVPRQSQNDWKHIFISKKIIEFNLTSTAGKFGSGGLFPLYLYPDENSLTNERTPNLNLEIIKEIEEKLGLKFVNEKEQNSTTFAPIDILDYIYAVLHSPNYREKYKEFLKIDFPRVPYPTISNFWQLVEFGGKLRALHLLEDTSLDNRIIDIKGEAELKITNKLAKKDTVINDNLVTLNLNSEVSIINIPLVAWEFYIGGYQPAQKWLKDRVERTLSRADLKHYNRIINALCKTDEIMKKIDGVLIS